MDEARGFLPTVTTARAAGLLDGLNEPYEEHAYCGLVVRARVVTEMFEIYVPRAMSDLPALHGFESSFEMATAPNSKALPPDCLRCHNLRPQQGGGAYRAAQVMKEPDFHGFGFADTIDQAEEDLKQFFLGQKSDQVSGYEVLAYAWPLRWLRFRDAAGEQEAVIYVKRDGGHAVFRSSAAE